MSSRVRRPTASSSGGKILRRRRSPPSASPYPRHGVQSGGAMWISGIVAGAGKLISSVFKSESPSPSTSYSYSTDNDSYDEDTDVSSQEPDEQKLTERKLEPVKDCYGTSLAIISEIKSKHAIEQLIMQETFTRDEGKKLIKIIESRVVEVANDGTQKELFVRTTCNAANVQAKKWLEDKMLASSSKVNFDSRPCNLNTSMLQYDIRGEEGSPVDVAKSYMRSLSPWKTVSWSSIGLEKSPCTGMHFYKDSTTLDFSVPSSKGLKRNYPALGLQDKVDEIRRVLKRNYAALGLQDKGDEIRRGLKRNYPALGLQDKVDEIRRVRLKSTDDLADTKCKPIDVSERYSGDEACKISSVDDELIRLNSNKLSDNAMSDTEEVVNVTRSTHETSLPATLPSLFCDPAGPISEENQYGHWQLMEQLDRLSGPCSSHIAVPASVEHAGNHVETPLIFEAQTLPPVDFNFTPGDAEAATRLNDFNTSSMLLSSRVENSSLHQKPVSVVKETHSVAESTQHDRIGQAGDERSGLRVSIDGLSAELDTNVAVALTEDPDASNLEGTLELPSTATTNVHVTKTNNNIRARSRSRGGSIAKSVKDVSKEPESGTGRGRARKSVPGAWRGRGK